MSAANFPKKTLGVNWQMNRLIHNHFVRKLEYSHNFNLTRYMPVFFFLSGFSFKNIYDSEDSMGRGNISL